MKDKMLPSKKRRSGILGTFQQRDSSWVSCQSHSGLHHSGDLLTASWKNLFETRRKHPSKFPNALNFLCKTPKDIARIGSSTIMHRTAAAQLQSCSEGTLDGAMMRLQIKTGTRVMQMQSPELWQDQGVETSSLTTNIYEKVTHDTHSKVVNSDACSKTVNVSVSAGETVNVQVNITLSWPKNKKWRKKYWFHAWRAENACTLDHRFYEKQVMKVAGVKEESNTFFTHWWWWEQHNRDDHEALVKSAVKKRL